MWLQSSRKKKEAREAKQTRERKITEKQGENGGHGQEGEKDQIRGNTRGQKKGNQQEDKDVDK